MKISELQTKTLEQLNEILMTLLKDQFNLRMQKATSQLTQTHLVKKNRKDIAKVKTVITQVGKVNGK